MESFNIFQVGNQNLRQKSKIHKKQLNWLKQNLVT